MIRILVGLLLVAVLFADMAHAHDVDPVEAALSEPPATGLLVTGVVPGTQSHASGIVRGDVMLSYAGRPTPTADALNAAKEAALEDRGDTEGPLTVLFRRAATGESEEVPLAPGPLGLQLVPIEEGRPPEPLPPDTGVRLDLAALGDRAEWSDFLVGGEKRGLEHVRVTVDGDVLRFEHEVAVDFGPPYGLHHAIVRGAVRVGTLVRPLSHDYENGLNGWISRSAVVRDAAGRATWRAAGGAAGEDPTVTEKPLPGGVSALPTYAVAQIARLLPHEQGACLRFRPLADWDGEPQLPAAIVCVGRETLTVGDAEIETWKVEQRQLAGGVTSTYWFDDARRLVRADYGGPVCTMSTAESARDGLHEELRLRTAE